MAKFHFAVLISLFLVSCSQDTTTGSYAQIVVINDSEYNGAEDSLADYEAEKVIGKVLKKVSPQVFPANNQSNFFGEGTVIFSVKGHPEFVIAEDPAGRRHLLQYAPGNGSN